MDNLAHTCTLTFDTLLTGYANDWSNFVTHTDFGDENGAAGSTTDYTVQCQAWSATDPANSADYLGSTADFTFIHGIPLDPATVFTITII